MSTKASFDIRPARSDADMAHTREMFVEYQQWLGVDLCFQDFENEIANLPGKYAPPGGDIFIARDNSDVAGIVAVRPVGNQDDKLCEMKRLYVRDQWRGQGLGRTLAELALSFAENAGYRRMVLDTLSQLKTARDMYLRMGFLETKAYYDNPLPGVVYMEKIL
ncbi:GNAT family N-acetyltransferase [Thalassospiraceae bacterium LMO-JJ14]|nr:GNAT family N-acetyltransferase [Thalassospiraceae bacterium LMO-JJ14]